MELLDDTGSSGELPADKRVGRQPVSKLGDDSAAWEIRDSTQWLGDTQVRYRQEFRRARFDDRARGCRPYSPRSDHNGRRSRRTWSPLSKEAGVGQQQPVRTTPTTQLRGGTRNIDGRGLTAKLETHCAAAQFVTLPENARYRRCGSDTEGSQRALSIPGSVGSSGLGRGLARSFSQPPAKTMRPEPMRGHRCLRPPQRYCPEQLCGQRERLARWKTRQARRHRLLRVPDAPVGSPLSPLSQPGTRRRPLRASPTPHKLLLS